MLGNIADIGTSSAEDLAVRYRSMMSLMFRNLVDKGTTSAEVPVEECRSTMFSILRNLANEGTMSAGSPYRRRYNVGKKSLPIMVQRRKNVLHRYRWEVVDVDVVVIKMIDGNTMILNNESTTIRR